MSAPLNRRKLITRAAGVLGFPALVIAPRSSYGLDLRPDAIDQGFWSVPRSIEVFNAQTKIGGVFTYWRDGEYVMDEYLGLSALVLDHHQKKAVQMQPACFDLIFACQRWFNLATGKKSRTIVTSGYRTANTNIMVGGVPGGQHEKFAALDGTQDSISNHVYASMLQAFEAGGVGLYARHVHWDVGRKPTFWHGSYRES